MNRLIAVVIAIVMLVTFGMGSACAETDTRARNQIKKLETRVETLENKIVALQLLVQRLTTEKTVLQGKVDSNFALIKALATQLSQQKQ